MHINLYLKGARNMSKLEVIKNSAIRGVSKIGFELKKHSPEILVVAGIIGAVTSTVLACKATVDAGPVIDEAKEDIDKIHDLVADEGLIESGAYSKEEGTKALAGVYAKTGIKIVKLYAPALIIGSLSVTSILASNNILRKRNVALAAAYATIDKSFKKYRQSVLDRFGDEVDKELRYGLKTEQITETVTDEKGNTTEVTKNVRTFDDEEYSEYAIIFDEVNSDFFKRDAEYNRWFLSAQERFANDKLKANGYLFLNDVFDMIGVPRTKAGQVVGWIYDPKRSDIDNYVDFGIMDITKRSSRDFVDGYEAAVILDFNVDGPILNTFKSR